MKQITIISLLFTAIIFKSYSQDGKIIEQKPFLFADTTISQLEKTIPEAKQILASVDFYKIKYLSDGLAITGYLAVPKKTGKYPCVIFNRGGNRELGALNPNSILRFLGLVSSWDYVVIGSQYRGNDGGEGKDEFGGKDVNDVLNLIPCLQSIGKADTSRLGMFGWSRGGLETYLSLTKTCCIKAAVIGSGAADAFTNIKMRPNMDSVYMELAPGYFQNRDSVLKERSPVFLADKICSATPLLLLIGSADWRVSPQEQLEMVNKLYELKHPLRVEFLEGGQHSLIEHYDEVNRAAKLFLDTYVRDKKPLPDLEPHGN
jgi:dipeptidyl aminopeptidase/acylaminoacyl peptidase